jgi:VanZ family protein
LKVRVVKLAVTEYPTHATIEKVLNRGRSLLLQPTFVPAVCGCVLLCILTAGLWPFHAPRNQVSWLPEENGLLFGKHGSVVSASPFKVRDPDTHSCSLQIWLQPNHIDAGVGMILAFYSSEKRAISLALRQWHSGMVIERGSVADKNEIYIDGLFTNERPAIITITSSETGTTAYLDGKLLKTFSNFAVSSENLTGQLVLGNAPRTNFSWSGQIKRLAIYDRKLSAAEVSQSSLDWALHYETSVQSEDLIAYYLFREGKGDIVRNEVDPATNLIIPKHFFILQPWLLQPLWDDYHPDWHYWEDVGVNVVGFVPLGFFFCAYFSQMQKVEHSAMVTIMLGFAISLMIEVLQSFLPTRESDMTDLITNTLGTAFGVMAYKGLMVSRNSHRGTTVL